MSNAKSGRNHNHQRKTKTKLAASFQHDGREKNEFSAHAVIFWGKKVLGNYICSLMQSVVVHSDANTPRVGRDMITTPGDMARGPASGMDESNHCTSRLAQWPLKHKFTARGSNEQERISLGQFRRCLECYVWPHPKIDAINAWKLFPSSNPPKPCSPLTPSGLSQEPRVYF